MQGEGTTGGYSLILGGNVGDGGGGDEERKLHGRLIGLSELGRKEMRGEGDLFIKWSSLGAFRFPLWACLAQSGAAAGTALARVCHCPQPIWPITSAAAQASPSEEICFGTSAGLLCCASRVRLSGDYGAGDRKERRARAEAGEQQPSRGRRRAWCLAAGYRTAAVSGVLGEVGCGSKGEYRWLCQVVPGPQSIG